MRFIFIIFILIFSFTSSNEILAQCQGSFGDPIVNITFGAGANPGPALSAATTNYQYTPNDCPTDGFYTVRNNTTNCFSSTFFSLTNDHTGDPNGYFMLINSSLQPSAFYIDTIRGLCSNSTYEFAAWVINILKPTACNNNGVKPNISFIIEKTDGTFLASSTTGDIQPTNTPTWVRYPITFTTPVGVSDIIIKMVNNGPGGCGNDLALDDITFRRCGPQLTPTIQGLNTTNTKVCFGTSQNFTLGATITAGFTNPVFQWQQSFNGSTYTDIAGANTNPVVVNFNSSNLLGTYTYRIAVAEQGTINSINCRVVSEPITFTVIPNPTVSILNSPAVCQNENFSLIANGALNYTWTGVNGFTSNTNPITINNIQLINAGSYFVTGTDADGCQGTSSTNIILNPSPIATTTFSDTIICSEKKIQIFASGASNYSWSPNVNISSTVSPAPFVDPSDSIIYKVVVTNQFNCKDSALVKVNVVKKPIANAGVDKIITANTNVQLNGTITGQYSNFYWTSTAALSNNNVLNPITSISTDTKFYLTATSLGNCGDVTDEVEIKIIKGLFIPNTFTPNGDNNNDYWNIAGIETYPSHELSVYNRYGQIVFERKQSYMKWDGKFNGENVQPGVYIYVLDLKNNSPIIKGSLLIIR